MHLSEFEKRIYNEYLKALRRGKPYSTRKNFDKVDDETFVCLKQLSQFFLSFPHIRIDAFFDAGFKDAEYQPLSFFKSMRAIKLYNVYMNDKLNKADDEWVLSFVKESLQFVYKFCKENNIGIDEYIDNESPSGVPWYAIHLKEFKVCIYLLLAFPMFENKLMQHSDEIELILGKEFIQNFARHRTMFVTSNKCKKIARAGLDILKTETKLKQTKPN